MSSPLPAADRPKVIATNRSSDGHIVHVYEAEAAEGAAEYLICWITGHGHSINHPASCAYCTNPIRPAVFAQTHCPYCDGLLRQVDFARNYCVHCGKRTTPSERFDWIMKGELGTRECARKLPQEKDHRAEAAFRRLCTEPVSAADKARIVVYSLDGDRRVTTLSYKLAVRWVAAGVAYWHISGGGLAALRMRELLPVPQPFWARASITDSECMDNALTSLYRVPSLSREKVAVWPEVGINPQNGEATKAPMLVWGRCQCPLPHPNTARWVAKSLGAARAALNSEIPQLGCSGVLEITSAIIRSFREHPRRKIATGYRPGALNVRVMSHKELDRLTVSQIVFADEEVLELELSSEGRAARLSDCEGDKSTAGEVQLHVDERTVADDIVGDIEQGGISDPDGGVPPDDNGSPQTIVLECDACWCTFDVGIDGRPDYCPHCQSANVRAIPKDADVRNEEEPSAGDDESAIPTILADMARLDGNLEELRNAHEAGLLHLRKQLSWANWGKTYHET